ncbi:DUF3761 domain-containing protein [Methylobacterium oryzae CBMB20]
MVGTRRSRPPRPGRRRGRRPFSEPDDRNLDRHGHYRSRDGSDVHRPARSLNGRKPAGASAKCRDGTWSFSHTHRGTCSRHGGVAQWEG